MKSEHKTNMASICLLVQQRLSAIVEYSGLSLFHQFDAHTVGEEQCEDNGGVILLVLVILCAVIAMVSAFAGPAKGLACPHTVRHQTDIRATFEYSDRE